jgi:hypothetical protein
MRVAATISLVCFLAACSSSGDDVGGEEARAKAAEAALAQRLSSAEAALAERQVASDALASRMTAVEAGSAALQDRVMGAEVGLAEVSTDLSSIQPELIALQARVGGERLFRPAFKFEFPGTGLSETQVTAVDVPIFTTTAAGVLEFRLQIGDVNAYYNLGNEPGLNLTLTPVVNGMAGAPVTVINAPIGLALTPPISGSVTFAVAPGDTAAVRVSLSTYPACAGGRGAYPICSLIGTATARFTPGVVLE